MKMKLKDCQNIRVRDYQHHRDYIEGLKITAIKDTDEKSGLFMKFCISASIDTARELA